jgi:peptidylprolyl isomerase
MEGSMQQAKRGDTVKIHYKGQFDDGTVFDTSEDGDPIEFTIGEGHVIPGFEDAVIGMATGEKKTEKIEADRAYGQHRPDLVFTIDRGQLPQGTNISVGDFLKIGFADGGSASVQVAEIADESVTLDANHPLAGKDLTFDLTLVSID